MKRYGNLWPMVTNFTNLLLAARQAQRGKRWQANVMAFNFNLEEELLTLQDELTTETYRPGPYHTFYIVEPKRRMISAAPYRDRVVHHALCHIIAPIFEQTFIDHSYANRRGLGTHRALRRFVNLARNRRYVLQCDVQQYFPSIDHEILKQLIRRKIKCRPTLRLIDTIIDHSNEQAPAAFHFPGDDLFTPYERRRGLPIGNLTSQFFANIYLNGFDHFVTDKIKPSGYLRYVDDFALFSDDREVLAAARPALENYLAKLRLKIHPVKSQLFATRHGANFLGWRVLPDRLRVRAENLRRSRRRLRRLVAAYRTGDAELQQVTSSLRSWIAHLEHGDTWRLRERVFGSLVFTRG